MAAFPNFPGLKDIVIECKHPFGASDVCLACLHADGRLELLSGAWDTLLGYRNPELDGLPLGSLLAESDALQRLLDAREPDPVPIPVTVKGGGVRTLGVYRRLDEYEPSLYLACEPFDGRRAVTSFASSTLSFASRP